MKPSIIIVNWQKLVANLKAHYKTLSKVRQVSGIQYQTLDNLYLGVVSQPKFDSGLILLNLHLDSVGIDKHKDLIGY